MLILFGQWLTSRPRFVSMLVSDLEILPGGAYLQEAKKMQGKKDLFFFDRNHLDCAPETFAGHILVDGGRVWFDWESAIVILLLLPQCRHLRLRQCDSQFAQKLPQNPTMTREKWILNVLRITNKKALRELASCLTLKSRSFGAQKKGSPHIPGSSSSPILGPWTRWTLQMLNLPLEWKMNSVVLGGTSHGGGGKGGSFGVFGAQNGPLSQRKSLSTTELFLSTTARRQTPLKTIKHHRPCAPETSSPHAFYTTKYCREKSDLSFSFLDFSDLSLSDDYFFSARLSFLSFLPLNL